MNVLVFREFKVLSLFSSSFSGSIFGERVSQKEKGGNDDKVKQKEEEGKKRKRKRRRNTHFSSLSSVMASFDSLSSFSSWSKRNIS